jgi:hypothetical protein
VCGAAVVLVCGAAAGGALWRWLVRTRCERCGAVVSQACTGASTCAPRFESAQAACYGAKWSGGSCLVGGVCRLVLSRQRLVVYKLGGCAARVGLMLHSFLARRDGAAVRARRSSMQGCPRHVARLSWRVRWQWCTEEACVRAWCACLGLPPSFSLDALCC